jgi:hypothetical protein
MSDPIRPNKAVYTIMATRFFEAIKTYLAQKERK